MPEFKPTVQQIHCATKALANVLTGKTGVKAGPGFYNPSFERFLLDEMLCGPGGIRPAQAASGRSPLIRCTMDVGWSRIEGKENMGKP